MIKVILLFVMGIVSFVNAGLTDFKTIEKANEAYEAGEYGKSASLFEDIKKSNATSELHYNLGNTYYKKGYYDKAIEEYETAEGVDEGLRQYNLGNSYFQKGDFDKAIESYEKSLKYRDDPDAKKNLEVTKKKKEEQQQQQEQQNKENQEQKKDDNKDQDQQQNQDQKGQDQQKQNQQNKEQNKKQDQKQKDNKEGKKKNKGDKEKSDAGKTKKPQDKKHDKTSGQPQDQKKMSREDKRKEQELKRLMKKMGKNKTPTMMYQMGEGKKGERGEDAKPW